MRKAIDTSPYLELEAHFEECQFYLAIHQKDFNLAQLALTEHSKLVQGLGSFVNIADAQTHQGTLYAEQSMYEEAEAQFLSALTNYKYCESESSSQSCHRKLGVLYVIREDMSYLNLARDHLNRSYVLAKEFGNLHCQALAAISCSLLDAYTGHSEEPIRVIQKNYILT